MEKIFLLLLLVVFISGCGGGSSSVDKPIVSSSSANNSQTSGCSVAVNIQEEYTWPALNWEIASPETQGMCPDQIEEAIEYAFQSDNYTGSVMVIRNGYIVAEQYSNNRSSTDLVTSWSVAKSFTSMLVGLAIEDSLINSLDQKVSDFINEWKSGEKEVITLRQLMNVQTALELLDGGDLYNADDQLQISIDRNLIGTPGEKLYSYSNSDVMLAGHVVEQASGTNLQEYLDSKIAGTIRFSGEWWKDNTGNTMAYCCLDSTPRDFARFGLLFSRNGVWEDQQLIPSSWVSESTTKALEGEYGFYWWPAGNNGYSALGVQGQIISIYPEEDLVILRFSSYTRMGDGSAIRKGNNYHSTQEPMNFDNSIFLEKVFSSIEN
ncbi:MAG: serine hydrolase [Nitrosomonadaceae bacterium]|nr:serine hydrolase [Nitrosomonadaceae bacterium]